MPRRAAEVLLDALEIGVGRRGGAAGRRRPGLAQAPDELLGLADRQVLADDGVEDAVLELGRQTAERPAVALGQPAVRDRGLDARGEVEQAQRVRDRRSGAADAGRDVLLAEPELLDELAVGVGRLERVEVLALEVLDEREFELLAIGELAHDRRDAVETGGLRGPQPALAGDELVAVERLGDEDRLEDAVLGDARRERRESFGVEPLARLVRVRADPRRSAISIEPGCPGLRCGMSEARPRPRPWGRSGRTVMTPPSLRRGRRVCRVGRRPSRARTSVGQRGVRDGPGRIRAHSARSAGRGSGPRTAGRCAGSRSSKTRSPR